MGAAGGWQDIGQECTGPFPEVRTAGCEDSRLSHLDPKIHAFGAVVHKEIAAIITFYSIYLHHSLAFTHDKDAVLITS